MASAHSADGENASLFPPAGEVTNVGGMLAMFERAFKKDPNDIPDLDGWDDWLFDVASGERGDPNVERAARLVQAIHDYQEESTEREYMPQGTHEGSPRWVERGCGDG
jgi:hypothetical protein